MDKLSYNTKYGEAVERQKLDTVLTLYSVLFINLY